MDTQSYTKRGLNNHLFCDQKKYTLMFDVTGRGAAMYLAFIACSLAIILGRVEANPGIKLSIHINSFSIQSRSWLLHTDMMNTVCKIIVNYTSYLKTGD